jgi:hypothetical protein
MRPTEKQFLEAVKWMIAAERDYVHSGELSESELRDARGICDEYLDLRDAVEILVRRRDGLLREMTSLRVGLTVGDDRPVIYRSGEAAA